MRCFRCRYAARSLNAASRYRSRLRSPSAADFRMRSASVVLNIVACSFGGRRSQASSKATFRRAIVLGVKISSRFCDQSPRTLSYWATTLVSERDHRLTVLSPDDYLPCNFEALQNSFDAYAAVTFVAGSSLLDECPACHRQQRPETTTCRAEIGLRQPTRA
jgi:hypothetical protein